MNLQLSFKMPSECSLLLSERERERCFERGRELELEPERHERERRRFLKSVNPSVPKGFIFMISEVSIGPGNVSSGSLPLAKDCKANSDKDFRRTTRGERALS